jgi:hypothetical protein
MIPKPDPQFPIHHINPHRQILQHMPKQLRIIDQVRRQKVRRHKGSET